MKFHNYLIIALSTTSLAACSPKGSDSQETTTLAYPSARANLRFAATTGSQAAPGLAPASFAGVTVTTAQLVAAEVNFKGWESEEDEHESDDSDELKPQAEETETETETETEEEEGSDDENEALEKAEAIDFKGPYVVDLLTGASTPSITAATLPAGTYASLEFKLSSIENEDEDGAEEALAAGVLGASVFISGTLQVNGTWTAFDLTDRRDEDVKWMFPAPVSIAAGQTNNIVLSIPLDNWMNAAMLKAMSDLVIAGTVTAPTGGTLHFSSDQDSIAHALELNFEDVGEVDNEPEHDEVKSE